MTSLSSCNISSCNQTGAVICMCCQDYFCIDHLKQHLQLISNELALIDDETKELFDELNNVTFLQSLFLTELDKWRINAHRLIDEFFEKRKQEIEEFVCTKRREQKTEIIQLHDQVNKLIREERVKKEQIMSINDTIQSFKQKLSEYQFPRFTPSPLVIDDHITGVHQERSILTNFSSLPSPNRTIKLKESLFTIAAGNKYLLIVQDDNLCLLNRKLIVTKQISWTHAADLYDMIWSKTLARFLLITSQQIFILDSNTLLMEKFPMGQNSIISDWMCATCLDDKLFLSTRARASSIYEYSLLPSVQFIKEYCSPISCKKDEIIMDLSSTNNAFILIVTRNLRNEVRLDLCSSATLERYWTNKLGILSGCYRIRCCILPNKQWMAINRNKSELFHISEDGQLLKNETYNPSPCHAVSLESDALAILTTESINLHQLL